MLLSTIPAPLRPTWPRANSSAPIAGARASWRRGVTHAPVEPADLVDLPATTVRGWIRRAKANSATVLADATAAVCALDADPVFANPTGSLLGDVGRALSASLDGSDRTPPRHSENTKRPN